MTVIEFPTKLCAMCCGRATQSIDLVDEFGAPVGQKHMCDNYPFCDDDDAAPQTPNKENDSAGFNYSGKDLAAERRAAIEQCAKIAESMTDIADGSGEIYIARKIADEIRAPTPPQTPTQEK